MALVATYDEGEGKDKFLHKLVDGPKGEGWRMLTGSLNLDNSYPAGGYPLDLSARLPNLTGVFVEPKGGYLMQYDYTNKKLQVFYFNYPGAAAGAAIEVPAATNLAALVGIRLLALGY